MHSINKYNICTGINVYHIRDDKYKTVSMTLYINRPLSRDEATKNALLAKVLSRGTAKYNTISAINTHLEGLYGTLYNFDVSKKANIHSLHCSVSNISDKYTGENITAEAAVLMLDFVFDPYLVDGCFDKDYVDGEKQNLKDDIDAIINDKRSYANMRVIEEMCKGEDNAVMDCGYVEDLPKIDHKALYDHYKSIITTSPIDIYVVGEVDIEALIGVVRDYLTKFTFNIQDVKAEYAIKSAEDIRYVEEAMSVNQGKLAIGLRTGVNIDDPMYYALLVGNSIFGAGAHSKLFNNVREKLSLCYYASSRLDKFNAIMVVSSGIEFENYEKARDEIFVQLDSVKGGDFTDDELTIAKSFIINSYNSYLDSPYMLKDYYYSMQFSKNVCPLEEAVARVEKVSREDVIEAMKNVCADTVYFLKGRD